MAKYRRCTIVMLKGVGAASQDPTITLLQAKSDGGSSIALNFTRIDVKQASALSAVGQFTKVTQAAANTYTEATAGEKQALWCIEIDSDDFDDDYDWLQASIADVGSTSQVGTVLYILHEPKYPQAALPSAIV